MPELESWPWIARGVFAVSSSSFPKALKKHLLNYRELLRMLGLGDALKDTAKDRELILWTCYLL